MTSRRISCLVSAALMLFGGSAWAATSAIEGNVTDLKGQVLPGADVRIEATGFSKMVKTDAKGHYVYGGLSTAAAYRVTLLVNGAVKASINNVRTRVGEPTQLNFDLKTTSVAQAGATTKKKTHKVWIPAETGSNLGGRWVEVEDGGSAGAGVDNVQKGGNSTVRAMMGAGGQPHGGN